MKNVTFLELGLTNTTYLENGLFVKKSNFIVDDFLDRKNEFQVLKLLSQEDYDFLIKPVKFGYSNSLFTSSFPYLKNSETLETLKIDEPVIVKISEVIKSLHAIEFEATKIKKFNYKKMLAFFEEKTTNLIVDLKAYQPTIKNFVDNLKPSEYRLCHNDLVPGNFLFTDGGKLKIIDYDFMSLNDPLFDLASFVSETLEQDPGLTRIFLKQFDLSIDEYKKITNYIFFQNYLWCYWAMYMFQRTQNPVFETIALQKFNQLKNTKTF